MLKCKILDVQGFDPAIHGMRNPKNSWDSSDSDWIGGEIGPGDLKLMRTLFHAGTEHRKYDRMIQVWMDIDAPLYWWKEFDTYKIGTVANSCSTMHKIHSRDLTLDDFSTEHLTEANLDVLKATIEAINKARVNFIQDKNKDEWWQMIQLLPTSFNQKRTVSMNYEVVARIIEQRSHHKLDEWHQLVDELRQLPYVLDLIEK